MLGRLPRKEPNDPPGKPAGFAYNDEGYGGSRRLAEQGRTDNFAISHAVEDGAFWRRPSVTRSAREWGDYPLSLEFRVSVIPKGVRYKWLDRLALERQPRIAT